MEKSDFLTKLRLLEKSSLRKSETSTEESCSSSNLMSFDNNSEHYSITHKFASEDNNVSKGEEVEEKSGVTETTVKILTLEDLALFDPLIPGS